MNKLQLYIYKSLRGFKSVRNFNPAENVQRHIHDVRQALGCLDYDPTEKYLFYLISYIDEGSFFTILRTIPDQPLDHLAMTIFVPNGLQIDASEMADIVKRTTRMVSNPSVSAEDVADLHEIFSKEYPVVDDAPAAVGSEGRTFAVCVYGGDNGRKLEDFFGKKLYQPEYLKYEGVVLIDAALGVSFDAPDLSAEPLADTVALLPPEERPDDFVPHIYHHVFDRPFLAPLGGDVKVVWRRGGFEDRTQMVKVESAGQRVEPFSTSDSRKTISPASFYITSQATKEPVAGAVISVNNTEITGPHSFTVSELKNADVLIRAHGFFPFHAHLDLAATTQALVQLQEQRKIYRFELPVKSSELGAPIHFEIHTKRELTDSPIEGYSLLDDIKEGQGRNNYLEFRGRSAMSGWRAYAIGAAAGLIVGIVLGWMFTGSSSRGDNEQDSTAIEETAVAEQPKQESKQEFLNRVVENQKARDAAKAAGQPEPKPVAAPSSAPVTKAAVEYLDSKTVWSKDDLDKYPELEGLFDDMNNFRLQRIKDYWGARLAKSKRFEKVAFHAGEGLRKKVFKPEGTYCKDANDHSITVQNYLNRIDPAKSASK